MTNHRPVFQLQRVLSDGTETRPEIIPVTEIPTAAKMPRRGFLGAGMALGAAVASFDSSAQKLQAGRSTRKLPNLSTAKIVLFAHAAQVTSLQFMLNDVLVSSSADGFVKTWQIDSGKMMSVCKNDAPVADTSSVSRASSVVSYAAKRNGDIEHWLGPGQHRTIQGQPVPLTSLTVDGLESLLVAGSQDGNILVWTLPDGRIMKTLSGDLHEVRDVAISRDGRTLLSGGRDMLLRVWTLPDGTLKTHAAGHRKEINTVSFVGSNAIASGSSDGHVLYRKLADVANPLSLAKHEGEVFDLASTRDGKTLVSCGEDGSVRVTDLANARLLHRFDCPFPVHSVAISNDDSILAGGDAKGVIFIWNIQSYQLIGIIYDETITNDLVNVNKNDEPRFVFEKETKKVEDEMALRREEAKRKRDEKKSQRTKSRAAYWQRRRVLEAQIRAAAARQQAAVAAYRAYLARMQMGAMSGYGGGSSSSTYCSCDTVCTCIPVCQALQLLDRDPVVRTMAKVSLRRMGMQHFHYMSWAADRACPRLRSTIHQEMRRVEEGLVDPRTMSLNRFDLVTRLEHPNEIVRIMSSQLLSIDNEIAHSVIGDRLADEESCPSPSTVGRLLAERIPFYCRKAMLRPWFVRHA